MRLSVGMYISARTFLLGTTGGIPPSHHQTTYYCCATAENLIDQNALRWYLAAAGIECVREGCFMWAMSCFVKHGPTHSVGIERCTKYITYLYAKKMAGLGCEAGADIPISFRYRGFVSARPTARLLDWGS